MANKQDVKITGSGNVPESNNFINVTADSAVTLGTNIDGHEILTFVFLNNYPTVKNVDGNLTFHSIEKQKVASVTMGNAQARRFYESLKSIFEEE